MGRLRKTKWCLLGCLIVVLVLMAGSALVPDRLANAVNGVANNDLAGRLRALSQQEVVTEDTLIEMAVESIGVSEIGYQTVVLLKEKDGERYLPIWIGLLEANAISVALEGAKTYRPLTPDLLCSIIDRTGTSIDYIVINDIQNETFFANIVVIANWTRMEIDSRPSDAIAIALRVKAPIYVEEAVLEEAKFQPEREADKYTTRPVEKGKTGLPLC